MIVALAGRSNVGKSSLFNRLVGRRKSLVWDQPGVTRDLVRGVLKEYPSIEIWDLAGHGYGGRSLLNLEKQRLSKIGVILLVVDGSEPLTQEDRECFEHIRKMEKPVIVAVNKADRKSFKFYSSDVWSEAPQNLFFISAETQAGLDELTKALEKYAHETSPLSQRAAENCRVLILGRPNVGKSSLLNRLAEQEISLTSPQAGTTRDIVEFCKLRKGIEWIFYDTAGIRKKSKIYGRKSDAIEIFSVEKTIQELRRCHLALFLVEATKEGKLLIQDRKLLHLIRASRIPAMVIVNKWDLFRAHHSEKTYREALKDQMGDLSYLPILFASAKTGYRVEKIFQALENLQGRIQKISTSALNRWLQDVLQKKTFRISKKGVATRNYRSKIQYLKFYYMLQTGERPMRFYIFTNAPEAVADEDRKFLINSLRRSFGLEGIPLDLKFRRKN